MRMGAFATIDCNQCGDATRGDHYASKQRIAHQWSVSQTD